MSSRIKVFNMRDIGLNANCVDDLMLFRDDAGEVRAIAVNPKAIPSIETARGEVIFEEENTIAKRQPDDVPYLHEVGTFLLVAVVSRSSGGLITAVFDALVERSYSFVLMDAAYPNIVTIYTLENNVIGVDDLPHRGLQPLVVEVFDSANASIWEKAIQAASNLHIVIVMHAQTHCVLEVYAPLYDYQTPPQKRCGRHQRVPFVQRKPLALSRDRKIHCGGAAAATAATTFVQVASEKEIPFGDWTVPVTKCYYTIDDTSGQARVWLWRERMCPSSKLSDMMRPLVLANAGRELQFSGFRRRYPLEDGGQATSLWFYLDLLGPVAQRVSDLQLRDAASVVIPGARNAQTIAEATAKRLSSMIMPKESELIFTLDA